MPDVLTEALLRRVANLERRVGNNTGPRGPQGPAGTNGTNGTNGTDGADGAPGDPGVAGQSTSVWSIQIKTGVTSGAPGDGFLIYNNASQPSATQLNISWLSHVSEPLKLFLLSLGVGMSVVLRDPADPTHYQYWTVTVYGVDGAAWTELAVELTDSNGADFANNDVVWMEFLYIGAPGADGAPGAAGTNTRMGLIAGGAAGAHTLTGILTGDTLLAVLRFAGAGMALTDLTDLKAEFTVSNDTIDNTAGTDTSGSKLLVFWSTP